MLGNRAHEGPQPPSKLEERKGLKEAQHAAHVLSAARPHPPRTRGVISASLEGSPPKPSTVPCASASLEGSEPALEKADHLTPYGAEQPDPWGLTPSHRTNGPGPASRSGTGPVSPRVPEMEMLGTCG